MGVRNKYCSSCSSEVKNNKKIKHLCFRNYKGSSTGMEQDIIVEGFRQSLEQHGLMYKYYIGDGDSSVYSRIIEKVSYGRDVVKLECANHITRNLHDGLRKLVVNKHFSIHVRKILSNGSPSPLERLVKGVRTAIKECGKSNNVNVLRDDLKNAPYHVLGSHLNCRPAYCTRSNTNEKNNVPLMESGKIMSEIIAIVDKVVRKADCLVYNTTTNIAENFMSLVAKFTGGKRVNYTKAGSYQRRVFGATQVHSRGPSWHLSPWKKLTGKSPGKLFQKNVSRRVAISTLKSKYKKQKNNRCRISRDKSSVNHDFDYGPDTVELDMTEEDFKLNVNKKLEELKIDVSTTDAINKLQKNTIGQHDNVAWHEARKNRLTASNFGTVICRKPTTSCHNLVKTLLYSTNVVSKSLEFGRQNEKVAIREYENKYCKVVRSCGLFVDRENPFLGASPDGLVDDDKIVEVKCTPSIGKTSLVDATLDKKFKFCLEVTETGQLQLKQNHKYYWQVQGQLNITNKSKCIFILLSQGNDLFIQHIDRDEHLWRSKMLPKLISFYMDCMLPEIIDPRIPRGLRIRDSAKITEAQFLIKKRKK